MDENDDPEEARKPNRLRGISSAHLMAFTALLFSLVSGAWAMTAIPKNSVGPQQIEKNAVGSSELASAAVGSKELSANAVLSKNISDGAVGRAQLGNQAVGPPNLQPAAVTQEAMAAKSVGAAQLETAAVAQANMQANSIGAAQLQAASIAQAKIQSSAVGASQLQSDAVTKSKLAPDATSSLYVHNEPDTAITGQTTLGTLSLPAGTYLLVGGAGAVHNGTIDTTRIECWLQSGATLLDYTKIRLQPNVNVSSLIFAKVPMDASLTLPAAGSVTFTCTSTNASSIGLSDIHLMALRVAEIIPQ